MAWHLGENKYITSTVESEFGTDFEITSADYIVYNQADASIVTSGIAQIDGHNLYFIWQPSEVGIYVADIEYVIGTEIFSSRQVVEVWETL